MRYRFMVSGLVLVIGTASGEEPGRAAPAVDRPYSLWNPKPRELRRDLSADRPDATESPFPVDPGAVQIELSVVEYAYEDEDGAATHAFSFAPINLKLGLTERADLQLLFNPYERVEMDGTGDADGVGSFGVRSKISLWGLEGGRSAGALLPYVVFPTGDRDVSASRVEWGVVLPVSFSLGGGWDLGAQAEIGFSHDGNGYDTTVSHTAVVGHDIVGDLAGYLEYIGDANIDRGHYSPSVSAGLTYALDADTQLDLGVVVGLDNPRTEDLRVFAGVTLRF